MRGASRHGADRDGGRYALSTTEGGEFTADLGLDPHRAQTLARPCTYRLERRETTTSVVVLNRAISERGIRITMVSKVGKRALAVATVGGALVAAGAVAFAANGPYSFQFYIPPNSYACTAQTRTASSALAPLIVVNMTKISGGGSQYAHFTAANTNCARLNGANTLNIQAGTGNHGIDVNDHAGQSIKLQGGTSLFQGGATVYGNWST